MRAKLNMHQKFLIAVTAAIVLLLLAAVGVWAYDDAQKDQIAPGVKVGGVNIGGRDADSARKIIKKEVVAPLKQPVTVTFDGKDYTLSSQQLHETADVDGMVQEAINKSRQGNILDRVSRYASGSAVNTNLEPRVGFDRSAVNDFVKRLADEINQDPVNASLAPTSDDKLQPEAGHPGVTVDQDKMYNAINVAAASPGRDQAIRADVSEVQPDVTKADLAQENPRYILIDRSNFTLYFFHHLKLEKKYTIAVGQQGLETPAGLYHATDKQVNPTWHVPDSAWAGSLAGQDIPPGPADPLKARWIGIVDGAGIHGTDELSSLGSAASHGCVRMAIPDVIDLYDRVDVGDPIYVK
jgi:lipoprotein-anchoring transpeptidase ErfK/SrfK